MSGHIVTNRSIRANFNTETKVILCLRRNPPGFTEEELSRRIGAELSSVREAVKKLMKKKLIFHNGEVRKTARGRGQVYARSKEREAPLKRARPR